MTTLRTFASAFMSRGMLSAGWYSVLTGLAFLVVGLLLASVSNDDRAASFVAVPAVLLGVWQLERGLRAEFQRRPRSNDDGR